MAGVSAKKYNLAKKVEEEDPNMGARTWVRELRKICTPENLIGYATFMGPSWTTTVNSEMGWGVLYNKFQPHPIYITEDWERLGNRADFLLTQERPNSRELARREDLRQKEMYALKAMAKELGLVKVNKKTGEEEVVSHEKLIDRIVKYELKNGGI